MGKKNYPSQPVSDMERDLIKAIGADCAIFRKEYLKVSQERFAEMTGYSQGAISAFELGKSVTMRLFVRYVQEGYDLARMRNLMEV